MPAEAPLAAAAPPAPKGAPARGRAKGEAAPRRRWCHTHTHKRHVRARVRARPGPLGRRAQERGRAGAAAGRGGRRLLELPPAQGRARQGVEALGRSYISGRRPAAPALGPGPPPGGAGCVLFWDLAGCRPGGTDAGKGVKQSVRSLYGDVRSARAYGDVAALPAITRAGLQAAGVLLIDTGPAGM